jgi:hypothetical protein
LLTNQSVSSQTNFILKTTLSKGVKRMEGEKVKGGGGGDKEEENNKKKMMMMMMMTTQN